jgi:hypothetical protein
MDYSKRNFDRGPPEGLSPTAEFLAHRAQVFWICKERPANLNVGRRKFRYGHLG